MTNDTERTALDPSQHSGVTRMWCHDCQHVIARTSNGDSGHQGRCDGSDIQAFPAESDRPGSPLLTDDDVAWLCEQMKLARGSL